MKGRRLYTQNGVYYADPDCRALAGGAPRAGDYWQQFGQWWAITPNGISANLDGYQIVDHPDGTVTVTPPIRCSSWLVGLIVGGGSYTASWHGHLTVGVWSDV